MLVIPVSQGKMMLLVILCIQGALISPTKKHFTTRSTVSPNDVVIPSVHSPSVPIKESSSRSDLLLGALSVTSALLPYIDVFTRFLPSGQADEVDTSVAPVTHAVVQTNNVSRKTREVSEEIIVEGVVDTFFGSLLGPLGVAAEIITIVIDVLAYTQEEGLTDPIILSRGKRDTVEIDLFDYQNDFARISLTDAQTVSFQKRYS